MSSGYNPHEIEKKWQAAWEKDGTYLAKDLAPSKKDQKFYGLIEFPYPSGEGLHVGHPRSYTAIDIVTRKKRMEGKDVLYPIGWDAFGLPTENFAIKNKVKPQDATKKNVANFTRQLKSLGFGFDWSREINTTDPKYYKWTQWMFLKFYTSFYDEEKRTARPLSELKIPKEIKTQGEKAIAAYIESKRMAYKASATINWCPNDKIGLSNEEAQGGVCERCGGKVEKREKAQWMIRITAYAERLLEDLKTVDYLERIKAQQINWIGKSEGASINFTIEGMDSEDQETESVVTVFTTRPDTLFGSTYLVLAPDHPLVDRWLIDGSITNAKDVQTYREVTRKMSDLERQENKKKTGVELRGLDAVNPATEKRIPVWIADYVLPSYGTGAIMAVPAHDERDYEFAKTFDLPWTVVFVKTSSSLVQPGLRKGEDGVLRGSLYPAYSRLQTVGEVEAEIKEYGAEDGEGSVVNSDFLNGLSTEEAREKMIAWLEKEKKGTRTINYKLRDWVFSRQRYWGEPIPIIFCDSCGAVPVHESELPVLLPDVDAYQPTDTGESPLAAISEWVNVTCPTCGGEAARETDTMPNWAGSSWYFLRYCDPHNDEAFADPKKLKFWMPVDLYNGGMEHTTLHLLYSRFWYKFLWDLGHVPEECGSEPYAARRSHALILGEGGVKMSKSKGNVVNPDDVVSEYGADVFRMYEMFIGPFDADAPWDTNGIEGLKRFLEKVWRLFDVGVDPRVDPGVRNGQGEHMGSPLPGDVESLLNRTIKKVGEDIETLNFNTAVSSMMILVNALSDLGGENVSTDVREAFIKILAPFAPHVTEELWQTMGKKGSIHHSSWPSYDVGKLQAATFTLIVQVNGKLRDKIIVDSDISEKEATKMALASEKVQAMLGGKEPQKIVYVKGRLISISI